MRLKSLKTWINLLTIAALIVLVVLSRTQIAEAFGRFGDLKFFWILFVIPLQLLNYYSVARFYRANLIASGEHVPFGTLYKIALEMNFVNNVFPSGGASGFGYFSLRLRKEGVPSSKSTLIQLTRHALTFVSIAFYLLLALFLLAVVGQASRLMVLISSIIILTIIFGSIVFVYIISNENRITNLTAFLPKLLEWLLKKFRGGTQTIDVDRIERLFGNLHHDYVQVRRNWHNLRYPFMWATLMNLTEMATVFVVFLAFGSAINPGALIVAYSVANLAGLLSILPGGVGVYEGLMTAVMASAGVPRGLALSATVVYRIINMGLFLPVGYYFYQQALKQKEVEP